jgi:hypothetical protein
MKKFVNLRDHCPTELIYRQTRKSLTHLKRTPVGIQPGAMPQLQFLYPCLLLRLRKSLLAEELLCTLHQLFFSPKVSILEE